jgi:hypothetical protein
MEDTERGDDYGLRTRKKEKYGFGPINNIRR